LILVVDDNRRLREGIVAQLVDMTDCDVEDAANAEEALEIILRDPQKVKIVVTNFDMGSGLNGIQLADAVSNIPGARPIFVLWTKKIDPRVVSDRFSAMLQKCESAQLLVGKVIQLTGR
jgi:CheY-like chemotaxis protein